MRNRRKRKGTRLVGIVIGVLIALLVLFAGVLAVRYVQYRQSITENMNKMDDLKRKVSIPVNKQKEPGTEEQEPELVLVRHDFEMLRQENEDIYAWIILPGTGIDYPVLQSSVDNKYLDTNLDGSKGYPGCIYSNSCNGKEFNDEITILYGHNLRSGGMFTELHKFEDEKFFDEYSSFTVETSQGVYVYELYAAVNYDDRLIPDSFDVKSVNGKEEFIRSLEDCREKSQTNFKDGAKITEEDKVLVLSVCFDRQNDRRYLIIAKRVEMIP